MHGLTDSLKTGFDGLRTICYIDHPEPLESSGGNFARIIFKFNMLHIICLTNQVIAVQPPDLILNLSYHLKIGNQLLSFALTFNQIENLSWNDKHQLL